jgi:hypothetical protein
MRAPESRSGPAIGRRQAARGDTLRAKAKALAKACGVPALRAGRSIR